LSFRRGFTHAVHGRNSAEFDPGHLTSLIRHLTDLRDGTHGGAVIRTDKEARFVRAVEMLAPVARQALAEMTPTCCATARDWHTGPLFVRQNRIS
jgi:hypothetical protein